MAKAVAIDLGAGSARFAIGALEGGRISYRVVEQLPHRPILEGGRQVWDLDWLLEFCRRAVAYAAASGAATVGTDAWGVDFGFLGREGELLQPPVCYRDPSHVRAFDALRAERARLYRLTGVQHQPFNTLYQLRARREERPELASARWLMLPSLIEHLLGGGGTHELTQASTTQLLGLDGRWCPEAFELAGFPVPGDPPELPGTLGPEAAPGVRFARVAGHDTASAVVGLGRLGEDGMFLNVGTWSLAGCLLDSPLVSPAAEDANFTNERAVDGRVRFLKNIPGFYVIDRLHTELRVDRPCAQWLEGSRPVEERLDLLHPDLLNPASMVEACRRQLVRPPDGLEAWAGLALASLAKAVADARRQLEAVTGHRFNRLRIGGGGSQSRALRLAIAEATSMQVEAGPAEATVVGNLVMQFAAQGQVDLDEVPISWAPDPSSGG
jgi:rhamnulokinase